MPMDKLTRAILNNSTQMYELLKRIAVNDKSASLHAQILIERIKSEAE